MVDFQDAPPEMSRPVKLAEIGETARHFEIVAKPREREALAKRFDLLGLEALSAEVTVERLHHSGLLRLTGHLDGRATQRCVVSLQPVEARISEDFVQLYTLGGAGDEEDDDGIFSDPDEETPEPLYGSQLDVGEAVAEQFALALDPYPRAPGAEAPVAGSVMSEEEAEARRRAEPGEGKSPTHRPFEALRSLKTNPKSGGDA